MKKFLAFSIITHLTVTAFVFSGFSWPESKVMDMSDYYVAISLSKEPSITKLLPKKTTEKRKILKDSNEAVQKQEDSSAEESVAAQSENLQKEKLTYKEELYHFLKNKNHYPRVAAKLKHSGKVRAKIKINKSGEFESVSLVSPSKFKTLNDGTLSFLTKVAKFKPLPKDLQSETFEVPIVYEL